MIDSLLILVGLALLVKGASLLIDSASKCGRRMGMSEMAVGLTVVAMGTSLPELFVSLFAASKGESGLALGNVIGSNILNIGVILGLTALIFPIRGSKSITRQEIPILIFIVGLVSLPLLFHPFIFQLNAFLGLILLFCMGGVLWLIKGQMKKEKPQEKMQREECHLGREGARLLLGILLLYLGSEALVRGAVSVATSFGVDPTLIGLTIVSMGTSTPELAACIACALKKSPEMALGNIVGSNIFNLATVLGLTLTFFPLSAASQVPLSDVDIFVHIAFTLLLLPFAITKLTIERWEGGVFLALYLGYLAYLWP